MIEQHRTVFIIFLPNRQTIITAHMLFTGGERGVYQYYYMAWKFVHPPKPR